MKSDADKICEAIHSAIALHSICIALTALAIVFAILCSGCTTVTYPTPAGDVTYTSFLTDRKLDSLEVTLLDGTRLKLTEYTSEQSKIAEAVARGVAEGVMR